MLRGFEGEYSHTPTTSPKIVVSVPNPDSPITALRHAGLLLRSGVKYSQCGIAPKYAPMRAPRVVYCTTSPDSSEMYTTSPFAHEYFHNGCPRQMPGYTVHWSASTDSLTGASLCGCPVHASAILQPISRVTESSTSPLSAYTITCAPWNPNRYTGRASSIVSHTRSGVSLVSSFAKACSGES